MPLIFKSMGGGPYIPPSASTNQSVLFSGTGTDDTDRIKISRVSNPSANNGADIGSTDMTMELWIKTTSGNNSSYSGSGGASTYTTAAIVGNAIIDCDVYARTPGFVWTLTSGRLTFGWNMSGGDRVLVGTTDLRDGAWHHIALCRNVTSGLVEMYADGVREATVTALSGDLSYPGGTPEPEGEQGDTYLVIGAEKHDVDPVAYPAFHGYMTELRLSNSLRYSGATYTVPTARFSDDANTEALYHMTESGATITDSSASGANGTLQSGASRSTETPF